MKRSSLYGHIVELFEAIRTSPEPADHIVRTFLRERHYLGSTDRRVISEAVFSIIRHHRLLAAYAREVPLEGRAEGLPAAILLLTSYLFHVAPARQPDIVDDVATIVSPEIPSADVKRHLEAIGTAVLPSSIRNDPAGHLSVMYSFPAEITGEWIARRGGEEAEQLCAGLNRQAPTTLRVNTLKSDRAHALEELQGLGVEASPAMHAPDGIILGRRVPLETMAPFKSGRVEIQDEGSQLLAPLIGAQPGMFVVDACAGGGGKTLHLAALMQNSGRILAMDTHPQPLMNLQKRAGRAGVHIVEMLLMPRDRERLTALQGTADGVLVDAPCSGWGTVRRNPALKMRWMPEHSGRYAHRQGSLLATYAGLVRPGGRLVYTTCTLLREENEDVVAAFLSAHPEFVPEESPLPPVMTAAGAGCGMLWPHKTGTDGFFAAVLRRRQG